MIARIELAAGPCDGSAAIWIGDIPPYVLVPAPGGARHLYRYTKRSVPSEPPAENIRTHQFTAVGPVSRTQLAVPNHTNWLGLTEAQVHMHDGPVSS